MPKGVKPWHSDNPLQRKRLSLIPNVQVFPVRPYPSVLKLLANTCLPSIRNRAAIQPTGKLGAMAPEYLNTNVVNFLVYRYLEEAGMFSSASICHRSKQILTVQRVPQGCSSPP